MFDLTKVIYDHCAFIIKLNASGRDYPQYFLYGYTMVPGCNGFLGPWITEKDVQEAWRKFDASKWTEGLLPVFEIGEQVYENVEREGKGSESMSGIAEAGASVVP